MVRKNRYIMYAMGEIFGKRYTNSLEAFQFWRSQGITAFEFDVFKFQDGKFGAIHSYNETRENLELEWDENDPPTLTEFLKMRLCAKSIPGGLTPLALYEIVKLMAEDIDVKILVDTFHFKSDEDMEELVQAVGGMAEKCKVKPDRIAIEAYTQDAAKAIVRDGRFLPVFFLSPHQTMGLAGTNSSQACVDFLLANHIKGASYPWLYGRKNPEYYIAMKKAGIKLYSFGDDDLYLSGPSALGVDFLGIHGFSKAGFTRWAISRLNAYLYSWLRRLNRNLRKMRVFR